MRTMAEAKKQEHNDFVYVTIPEKDLFDRPIKININTDTFEAGTHFVHKDIAGEITRILKSKEEGDVRILQPKKDLKALRQLMNSSATVAQPDMK